MELLAWVVRDSQWALILAVTIGGVFVEILHDSALTPRPVSPQRPAELLRRLRGADLFNGFRGGAVVDVDYFPAIVSRIGDLAVSLGVDLESLEVNPRRVDSAVVEVLDAVVTRRKR